MASQTTTSTPTPTPAALTYSARELSELRAEARLARDAYPGWPDVGRREVAAHWLQVAAELLAAGHIGESATARATSAVLLTGLDTDPTNTAPAHWTVDEALRREG